MDFIASILNSSIFPYLLGAVVLLVLYQQLAPRLRFKVGSGPSLDGLLGILLGPRFAAAKVDRAVARERKAGNYLEAGRVLGEMGLYMGIPRTADVIASRSSLVYRVSAEALERMRKDDPEVAAVLHEWIARQLAERLAASNRTIEALMD